MFERENLDSIAIVNLFHHIIHDCFNLEKLTYFNSISNLKSLLINKIFNVISVNFHSGLLFL